MRRDGTGSAEQSCAFLQGSALSVDDQSGQGGDATGWSGVAGGGGKVRPDLWLGAGAGYRGGNLDGGDYDRLSAYLWSTWASGGAELKGFAGLGHYEVDGSRRATSGQTASWDYGAWQPFVAAEARYWTNLTPDVAVTPLAGLTSVWLDIPGHGESGAGIEDFNVAGESLRGLTSLLGGEVQWQVMPSLAVKATAGWQHLFGDDAVQITGAYAGIPGSELTSSSDVVDRDSAALGLGLLMPLTDTALLRLDYDADVAASHVTQSGFARLTVAW